MNLRQHLLASAICVVPVAASAADLPVKAPMRVVQPAPFTWTGFYVGGSAGLISQNTVHTDLDGMTELSGDNPGSTYGVPGHGGLFGINIGYNRQFAPNWVLGIEADIAVSTLDNTTNAIGFSGCRFGFQSKLSSLGTVRGRIGYAFDRALLYATGGYAYGRVKNNVTNTDTGGGPGEPEQFFNSSAWKTGWTAGGGLEYAVTNNWTVRCEALYVDLGTTTVKANDASSGCRFGFKNTYTIGRIGMNYKF